MPKTSLYPRLRAHVRKGKGGQRWTYWYYDMRPDGKPDIPLGRDHAAALARWDELHNQRPAQVGRIVEATKLWRARVLPTYTNAETRRSYGRQLDRVEAWCGQMTWEEMTLPLMRQYLRKRTGKTQANREMSVLSIVWSYARMEGLTGLAWPAAGVKDWKNEEHARDFEVTDQLFAAVYAHGDQVLRDCMDIASATGMRLTDTRTILLPPGDTLRLKASKTGKLADFLLSLSEVLPEVIARRRAQRAEHLMLLSTPSGRPVTARMLRTRWDTAREAAATAATKAGNEDLAQQIRAMYLRDMRKLASDLAPSLGDASRLLQHSSEQVTQKHYRKAVAQLRPVR
jgi:hypothetical protein